MKKSSPLSSFSEGAIESIAKLLGDVGSGSDISRVLNERNIEDDSGHSTKWRRLYHVFLTVQKKYNCPNHILDFIKSYLTPARFVGRSDEFERTRKELNAIISFEGLEYGEDGNFRIIKAVSTLSEAEQRLKTIRNKFQGRILHYEVLKYCKTELLQDNYFHAVFEASKGLAQRVRELSGISLDGSALVDKVFSIDLPYLAINSLQSETERSEHKGFAALLKGCFAAVRNPLAHEPKILWNGVEDAADYLSLISLLHRKLDGAVTTHLKRD